MQLTLHDEIEPLLPAWERVFAADPEATPFVSPGWARAWWSHWAESSWRPWILAVEDAGEVVGLAPLVLRRRGPLRILRVLGEEPGDYWNVLARPDVRDEVVRGVVGELERRRGQWDALALKRLPHGSLTESAVARSRLTVRSDEPERYPVLELPDTFDRYLASLSSSRRGNLRRHLRRLDDGEIALRDVSDAGALPAAIERWQRFRVKQWDAMEKSLDAEHAGDRFRDFTQDVARALVPLGLCRVTEFVRAGQPVASYVNFTDDRAFYWYLGGFDPSVASLGIGKIAIGEGIRSSIAAGRRWYDFLRGAEGYKYWYGAADRTSPSILLHSRRPRSRVAVRLGTASGRL
jgi:CelD/BcsL family acetyltransferase involved in cellulose biosynthesis